MKKQFVITTVEAEGLPIEISDFELEVTLVTDLNWSRDGSFAFDIEASSSGLVNVTPQEQDDPYEAQITVNTEYLKLNLDKLGKPFCPSDLSFFLEQKKNKWDISKNWNEIIDCEEGVGSYYVDQYYEMENWKISLESGDSTKNLRLRMSANDHYDKHAGFNLSVPLISSNFKILIRGGDTDSPETLKEFCAKYFELNDLDVDFNEHETEEGFKKIKKVRYDLVAKFK